MPGTKSSLRVCAALAVLTFTVFAATILRAQQETVLHSFGNSSDGVFPVDGLIFDISGNLYGTTYVGGIHSAGTVFELSPQGGGGWTETVLHSFGNGTDGSGPEAGLILDSAGNLYGTTAFGGIYGLGTVFELSPRAGGGWTETVLHSFGNGNDGQLPVAPLVYADGNLYGTTNGGGIHDAGTVFELSPNGGGGYTETLLHNFGNPATNDGSYPSAGLVFDSAGNLYSTTSQGGIHGFGTAFELSPRQGGGWTETLLHNFGNPSTNDGYIPYTGLIFDSAGNLYGTTSGGGIHGGGTAFELSPRGGGSWTETVLHNFGGGTDGAYLLAGLAMDTAGNLYGTTDSGGIHSNCSGGCGTAFELSPRQGGGWTERVLHNFGSGADGNEPAAGLVLDSAGNLYGTTEGGGIHSCGGLGCGTAFKIAP